MEIYNILIIKGKLLLLTYSNCYHLVASPDIVQKPKFSCIGVLIASINDQNQIGGVYEFFEFARYYSPRNKQESASSWLLNLGWNDIWAFKICLDLKKYDSQAQLAPIFQT